MGHISKWFKRWDYDVPSVELWHEVLRVLKPGAHALIACGTRTQHRMAVNIEDAGFEIRDVISWVYGSGFPKSLNIGKAINQIQEETDPGNVSEVLLVRFVVKLNPPVHKAVVNKQVFWFVGLHSLFSFCAFGSGFLLQCRQIQHVRN